MTGAPGRLDVGVFVDRLAIAGNPWIDHKWQVAAVVAGAPEAPAWTTISKTAEATRYFAGTAQIDLFPSDSANLADNLTSPRPSLWVVLGRTEAAPGMELRMVTADPAEGEGATQAGDDLVEAVPIPEDILAWITDFTQRHPPKKDFFKRRRE